MSLMKKIMKVKMMTFEEDFPLYNKKEVRDVPETQTKRPRFAVPESLHKDCISKQKVKEVIDKLPKLICMTPQVEDEDLSDKTIRLLKKELGLM